MSLKKKKLNNNIKKNAIKKSKYKKEREIKRIRLKNKSQSISRNFIQEMIREQMSKKTEESNKDVIVQKSIEQPETK